MRLGVWGGRCARQTDDRQLDRDTPTHRWTNSATTKL